ncbi:MAG TPA: orotate phosphoribosyltransferase [Dehalococcoidia bacterium]|nr:orotate phosphoribosyltransferase [Dehalococcoidia bacterium]
MPRASPEELASLARAIEERCIRRGEFRLASGLASRYYYDGKQVTLHPRWAEVIGRLLLAPLLDWGAQAVGGMATGAIPIAVAVSLAGLGEGLELPVFYVREGRKGHGAQDEVAGADLVRGLPVAIVEDVVTTGGSALRAAAAVEALGCRVVGVAALVERHEGGGEAIRDRGYPFFRLFYTDQEGQLYPDERARALLSTTG